jgi:hypothetical protein
MNDELLKHALAVTGTVLYVARAAPATIQIARRREVDPEAATTFGLLLLTGLWWVAYSLEVHNLPSLLSAVLGLLAPAYGLLVLWRVPESVAASRSCWWPGSPSRLWKS